MSIKRIKKVVTVAISFAIFVLAANAVGQPARASGGSGSSGLRPAPTRNVERAATNVQAGDRFVVARTLPRVRFEARYGPNDNNITRTNSAFLELPEGTVIEAVGASRRGEFEASVVRSGRVTNPRELRTMFIHAQHVTRDFRYYTLTFDTDLVGVELVPEGSGRSGSAVMVSPSKSTESAVMVAPSRQQSGGGVMVSPSRRSGRAVAGGRDADDEEHTAPPPSGRSSAAMERISGSEWRYNQSAIRAVLYTKIMFRSDGSVVETDYEENKAVGTRNGRWHMRGETAVVVYDGNRENEEFNYDHGSGQLFSGRDEGSRSWSRVETGSDAAATDLEMEYAASIAQTEEVATFTDPRDGQTYRTVRIGNRVWMAENLNYQTDESYCYETYGQPHCGVFGRLYTWNAAMSACPEGWRLSNDDDWIGLITAARGDRRNEGNGVIIWENAGARLRAKTHWFPEPDNSMTPRTDDLGFSALPGGGRNSDGFGGRALYGFWWSATETGGMVARYHDMRFNSDHVQSAWNNKTLVMSVRCVMNR